MGVETKLIKDFDSRKEFNAYKKQMESFLERDADFTVQNVHGAKVDYSKIMDAEKVVRRINRQKQKQWETIKDLPITNRGYQTGMTVEDRANPVYGMGDVKYALFNPIDFDPNKYEDSRALERRLNQIKKTYDKPNWLNNVNEMFRDNYILAMENNLGQPSKELQDHVKNMPIAEFIQRFYTENNAHIDFIYDLTTIHARVDELKRVWGL